MYILGTDALGRDIFTRLLYGARASLSVAAVGVAVGSAVGVLLGLLSGYFGGKVDAVVMRIVDIQLAFPYILLALAVVAVLGASLLNLVLVLGLRSWVVYARTIRGSVMSAKQNDYVHAAVAAGANNSRVLWYHILPNVLAPILVLSTVQLAQLILMEATLSFLGFGVQPPFPSWGGMLAAGRNYVLVAWWLATFPGLAIMFAVFGANLLGDGLRDALDPRLRRA